jgi:outer membrane protein OmpA-like peptidoglycan-associated protein
MLLADSEGKARGLRVQPAVRRASAAALLLFGLAGCSDVPNQANPVSWWHSLEGGEIAKYRPPPPNPHAPFPHIAAQPTRPVGMPDWEWQQLSKALAGQRNAAQTYAAQNPIPTLPGAPAVKPNAPPVLAPAPAAAPLPKTAAPAPSAETAAALARLQAAPGPAGSAPMTLPPGEAATAAANAGNNTNSALTFNGPSAPPASAGPQSVPIAPVSPGQPDPGGAKAGTKIGYFDPTNGLSVPGALGPVEQPDEAHPPEVPTEVPVPPAVPGFAIPTIPATYAPPKAVPEPAPYVAPRALPDVPPVPVSFARQSAVLTPPMQKALHDLSQAAQGAHIAVTGFGDATGASIADQAAAMPLALERARALTVQLLEDGVPGDGLTTQARALGSGGLARLGE